MSASRSPTNACCASSSSAATIRIIDLDLFLCYLFSLVHPRRCFLFSRILCPVFTIPLDVAHVLIFVLSNLTHRLGLCLLAASSWHGLNTAIILSPFLSCNSAFTIPGWNLHAQFTVILAFSQSPFRTLAYTIITHHLIHLLELSLSLSSSIASFPPDMLCPHLVHSRSPSTLE